MNRLLKIFVGLAVTGGVIVGAPLAQAMEVTGSEHISKSSVGAPADRSAFAAEFTPDGRYAVYYSTATNLGSMPSSTGVYHTYVYDRQLQTTEMVSLNASGQPAVHGGMPLGISDDGRYVFILSDSTDMPGYTQPQIMSNPTFVYVRDRQAGSTARIGDTAWLNIIPSDHSVSADGNLLAFQAITHYGGPEDITTEAYIFNRNTGAKTLLPSGAAQIQLSANGQVAAYKIGAQLYRYTIATAQSSVIGNDLTSFALSPDGSHLVGSVSNPSSGTSDIQYLTLATGDRVTLYSNAQGYGSNGYAFDRLGKRVAMYVVSSEPLEVASKAFVIDVTSSDQVVVDTGLHKASALRLSADGSELLFSSFTRLTGAIDNHQVFTAKLRGADIEAPTVSNLAVNPRLVLVQGTMAISATASDSLSGVSAGEYYMDTDPGMGNGIPMTYSSSTGKIAASRQFTPGTMTPGFHTLYVRAVDGAGNWSTLLSKTFIYIGF